MPVGLPQRFNFSTHVSHRTAHIFILDHKLLAFFHVLRGEEQLQLVLHFTEDIFETLFYSQSPF